MFNLSEIIAQIPINVYVLVGCLVVGWLMKKFLPTDNKIIPLVMVILGAIVYVLLEGVSVENIIIGAFTGAASTGLHQVFKQYVEGKDLAATNGDGSKAEDFEADPVEEGAKNNEHRIYFENHFRRCKPSPYIRIWLASPSNQEKLRSSITVWIMAVARWPFTP